VTLLSFDIGFSCIFSTEKKERKRLENQGKRRKRRYSNVGKNEEANNDVMIIEELKSKVDRE